MTNQPKWELIANLGDKNPFDYGGFFVYRDSTGVYAEECELLQADCKDDENSGFTIYRIVLERCTFTDGILSENRFHPLHAAWFARDLASVASYVGQSADELIEQLCSPDAIQRAFVYRAIGDYHGWTNFDNYPLELTREECEARYPQFA